LRQSLLELLGKEKGFLALQRIIEILIGSAAAAVTLAVYLFRPVASSFEKKHESQQKLDALYYLSRTVSIY
jgi:hypothetical protein